MLENRKPPESLPSAKRFHAMFEALKRLVLPALVKDRAATGPLRVWVPACAGGEQVYSLALTLLEFLEARGDAAPVKLFGTDVSGASLEAARLGIYSENSVLELGPRRLQHFFDKVAGGYQIHKAIRALCIFARQDVLADPPISKLDLIDARNLLIGLGARRYDPVLPVFQFALNPGGFLLLGQPENITAVSDAFAVVDEKHHIYRRTMESGRLLYQFPPASRKPGVDGESNVSLDGLHDVQRHADRAVLARYGPCGVIVDEDFRIIQFRGQTGPYLEPAPGTPTLNLLQMARAGLLADLRACLDEALRDNVPARREGARVEINGQAKEFALQVLPISAPQSEKRFLIVLFEEKKPPPRTVRPDGEARPDSAAGESDKDREIARLRQELAATRGYLQSMIEEKEAANEELQAASEEMVSSNEELQSTNEELETAQEELQVANEGLSRINDELEQRIKTASRLGDDLANLMDCIQMPTIVVGNDLRLRRLSPSALRVLNLVATDVGRPIHEFKLNINVNLGPLVHEVIDTLSVKQLEITDKRGCWFQLVIRPYMTGDHRIAGAVLTFMDIDALKRRERQIITERERLLTQLRQNQQFVDKLANTLPCILYLYDLVEHRHLYSNGYCAALLGYPLAEGPAIEGPLATEKFHPHDVGKIRLARQRSLQAKDGEVIQTEFRARHVNGGWRWLHSWDTVFLRDERGGPRQILGLAQDVTEQRYLEQEVLEIIAREQRRTGQELHDTVGQELTGLAMMADALTRQLADQTGAPVELARKIRDGLERVHGQMRSLSRGLVPVQVDAEGLRAALEDLTARTNEQTSMRCTFHCPQPVLVAEPVTATHLFRIAQEAVANALRHGRGHNIQIALVRDDTTLTLSVRDDGVGLPDALERSQGLGMRLMHFRANLIGATVSLAPAPGTGTLVTCSLAREFSCP